MAATELQKAECLYHHQLRLVEEELGLLRQHLGRAIDHLRAAGSPTEDMDAQDAAAEFRRGQRQLDRYDEHRRGVRQLLRDAPDPSDPAFQAWPPAGDWRTWEPTAEELGELRGEL